MRLLIALLLIFLPASAALPEAIVTEFKQHYKNAKERADGLMQADNKTWLLFRSENKALQVSNGSEIQLVIKDGDDFLFSDEINDWIFTPIVNKTVKSFDFFDPQIQAKILATNIVPTFLVPDSFELPRDLAITMGRLPLSLRSVELASDRELRFKERLLEEKANKPIDAISYSIKTGLLKRVGFSDLPLVENLDEMSAGLSYVSEIKTIDGDLYLLDYHQAKVFQITSPEIKYDSLKPNEEIFRPVSKRSFDVQVDQTKVATARNARVAFGDNSDFQNKSIESNLEMTELFDLTDLGLVAGLRDFQIEKENGVAYFLDSLGSNIFVVDIKAKRLIKTITIPAGCSDMIKVSRSSAEPVQIMMLSKSKSSLLSINSFDYRMSKTLDLNLLSKDFRYVPHALAVNESKVFVAVEAINANPQKQFAVQGKVLVLDAVTSQLISSIDLDYVPIDLLLAKDNKHVYALGSNQDAAFVSKIDFEKSYSVENANLAPDIIDPQNMTFANTGKFVLISSSGTNTIAVFDLATWSMVHKIDIGDSSSILLAL
ncbi:MAG: hypothetical protein O3C63_03750 [Cyanobacteria bacterium]|nr:hypothetical protein [Cyanobacteriota bacterium]MDA1020043.1 hypothetical protein [Cyanobacteriota bacterium]